MIDENKIVKLFSVGSMWSNVYYFLYDNYIYSFETGNTKFASAIDAMFVPKFHKLHMSKSSYLLRSNNTYNELVEPDMIKILQKLDYDEDFWNLSTINPRNIKGMEDLEKIIQLHHRRYIRSSKLRSIRLNNI